MTSRIDEVETAVDSVVNNMAAVESGLILKVALKLVIDVLDDGLETGNNNLELGQRQDLLFLTRAVTDIFLHCDYKTN